VRSVKIFTEEVTVSILKQDIVDWFGVLEIIVSDNGSQFKSREVFVSALRKALTADRVDRSLNAALRAYVRSKQREWDNYLSSINFARRNHVHQSTKLSTYCGVFGQHLLTHGKD